MDKHKNIIIELIQARPEVQLVILYGSSVRGEPNIQSDVDLALAGEKIIPAEVMSGLNIELAEALHREVDLVDMRRISGTILEQILCRGEVLVKTSIDLHAEMMRKMWYNQADMMPAVRRAWDVRKQRLLEKVS